AFPPAGGVLPANAVGRGGAIETAPDDQGTGMPPNNLKAFFARFYSDRPQTDSPVGKNSGLGLSICREIATAYGGSIWAENLRTGNGGAPIIAGEPAAFRDRRLFGIVGARFTVRPPPAEPAARRGAPAGRRS